MENLTLLYPLHIEDFNVENMNLREKNLERKNDKAFFRNTYVHHV